MLIPFEKIQADNKSVGGKAWGLALLAQKKFPVPPGLVLDAEPTEAEWSELLLWWDNFQKAPLAIRSSAGAEDSAETSFAGQNRTFLNITTELDLRQAIKDCFASIHRDNSKAYRQFFSQASDAQMNVVVQMMVAPQFSGVFFSEDPRGITPGWMLEVIEGLGEDLVSGKVTPGRLSEHGSPFNLPKDFSLRQGQEVAAVGQQVASALGFRLDMEWAFDRSGKFFVLQARPITASSSQQKINYAERELDRLKKNCDPQTTWDGQTFAEWSGLPSHLTYSLWKLAFSPLHAFGNALRELGYRSFSSEEWGPHDSLLERIFGRAFVNLSRLSDLYYGDIPYRVEVHPRPHTKFDLRKLHVSSFLHFPSAAWSMLRVGWNLSTKRNFYYQKCLEELASFRQNFERPFYTKAELSELSTAELRRMLALEADQFTTKTLYWPLILVILTESTTQSLRHLMKGVIGESMADQKLRDWLSKGLHTVTYEMQKSYSEACQNPQERSGFLSRYGHRGPGEMDLASPRWYELGEKAFTKGASVKKTIDRSNEVEQEIREMNSFKKEMILEEWRWMKKLLETREVWKMQLLKPYAWMRILILEIARRSQLESKIFSLTLDELLNAENWNEDGTLKMKLHEQIQERRCEEREFRKFSLPEILSFRDLEQVMSGSPTQSGQQLDGEPLAPGLAQGEVRFVKDPLSEDLSSWPANVILAAVSTDPGWTPLFAKAKGIVVERGGVLSHCAILAREMGLPAISGVLGLEHKLKSGDQIWVDGNHGRITRGQS